MPKQSRRQRKALRRGARLMAQAIGFRAVMKTNRFKDLDAQVRAAGLGSLHAYAEYHARQSEIQATYQIALALSPDPSKRFYPHRRRVPSMKGK